jgi:hypothetical protein
LENYIHDILKELPKVKILIASRTKLDTIDTFKETPFPLKGLDDEWAIKLFESY